MKGTMHEITYATYLNCLLENGLKETVFKEAYFGKRAAMLERKKKKPIDYQPKQLWELV